MSLNSAIKLAAEDESFLGSVLKGEKDLSSLNGNGRTALAVAVVNGRMDMVKQLLEKDESSLHCECVEGASVLSAVSYAVRHLQYSTLEYLVSRGANLDCGSPPPLYLADLIPQRAYFELLVKSGANLNALDRYFFCWRLLHHVVVTWNFQPQTLNIVLDNGADLFGGGSDGGTAFHLAIKQGNIQALDILLSRVHATKQLTSLDYASPRIHSEMTEETWNQQFRNIFTFAVCYGSLKCLKALMPLLDQDERTRVCGLSSTPFCLLHAALFHRFQNDPEDEFQIVKLLLESGVDPNACVIRRRNAFRILPLDVLDSQIGRINLHFMKNTYSVLAHAILMKKFRLVPLLLQHRARLDAPHSGTVYPLAVAVLVGHLPTCKLLLSHGANPNQMAIIGPVAEIVPIVLATAHVRNDDELLTELKLAGANIQLVPLSFWDELKMLDKNFKRYQLIQNCQ